MEDCVAVDDSDIPVEINYFKESLLQYLQKNGYDNKFPNYLDNETNILSNMLSRRVHYTIEHLKKGIIDSTVANSSATTKKAICVITMQNILLSIFASQLGNSKSN